MGFDPICTQTVRINGRTVYSSKMYPCGCSSIRSCFGFGFPPMIGGYGCGFFPGTFEAGLGFAAGAATVCFLPQIIKGVGKAASWTARKVIVPGAELAWKGICSIGKGVKNLFHKKSKEV